MARPIIYFGSSFNPITVAHLAMLEHLIREASKQDPRPIIMLAPVFKHVFSKPDLIDYDPRLEKTRLAVEDVLKRLNFEQLQVGPEDVFVADIDRVVYNHERDKMIKAELAKVDNDESKLPADWQDKLKVSAGTWKVINYLQEHANKYGIDPKQFRMALGNDTYEDLVTGLWYDELKIFDACQTMYVFDRDKKPILIPHDVIQKIKKNYADKKIELETRLAQNRTYFEMEENSSLRETLSETIKKDETALKALTDSWPKRAEKLVLIEAYWAEHSNELDTKITKCKDVVPEEFRDVSSTKVRKLFADAKKYLVEPVLDFIIEHELYDWAKNLTQEVKDYIEKRKVAKSSSTSSFPTNAAPTVGSNKDTIDTTPIPPVDPKRPKIEGQ